MGARRIPRRVGMLPSEFTHYQYLTTKYSTPCNVLVIPALVRCVQLIAVLKIEGLRVFDLDTETYSDHTEIQPSHLEENPPTLQHRGQIINAQ